MLSKIKVRFDIYPPRRELFVVQCDFGEAAIRREARLLQWGGGLQRQAHRQIHRLHILGQRP